MPQKPGGILSIIKTALKIESDGANFYKIAGNSASTEEAKKIFGFLAEEEKKHYDFFLNYYTKLEKAGKYDFGSSGKEAILAPKDIGDIFSKDFVARLKDDPSSLSAVSIGVKLENSSIDFYKKLASGAKDDAEKKFYDFLIKAEIEHHDFLSGIEKQMIEESWNENRFSPF